MLNGNYHHNQDLQDCYNVFGEDAFDFYVIEKCDESSLIEREAFYIKEWNTVRPHGFNGNTGGYGIVHHSDESRQKISNANSGEKHPMFGKHHSDETRHKMSESRFGKHHSDESRQKMSDAKRGKKMSSASSQYFGVYWNSKYEKWVARECRNGKQYHIGSFNDEIDAAKEYDNYCVKNGIDRRLNFSRKQ